MKQGFKSQHWSDENGCPQGGCSFGTGFAISWQNGALGRGEDRKEPNGAFIEDVLGAVIDRLEYYQGTRFRCDDNSETLVHLKHAAWHLNRRTKDKEKRGVEGTHEE
jgi:hypothetical protein